ncbi:DUF6583 family protein [Ruminococcus flavefaciens]|uniref:Uncharacterized protein n=1 Tax=Ruminococcus flavefaciens TaxID=1265 RepID=A0A1M7JKW7_RUMFL|nr:DUF6583 family protein [Ruminococcus flavefaciens]SHM53682.1 hypothetical protein SAMN04487860_10674 [Ruminococcus flavefaciens]
MSNYDQNNGFDNSQFDSETSAFGVENVTKKSKGKKAALIGGISAAVVVGGGAAAYAFSDTVKNQVKLRLSKPEKYYAWVTEKNSETLGEMLSESYKKRLDNMKKGQELDLSVYYEANDNVKDLIIDEIFGGRGDDEEEKQVIDIIRNTDKYALSANLASKKGNMKTSVGLDLDDERIVSFDVAGNTDEMDYFFRIPELKEKWLGFDASGVEDQLGDAGMKEIIDAYKDILKDPGSFLSPEDLETEVNRYTGVWSRFVDEVKLEKSEEIDICDITVKYTVATVELNDKDMDKLELEFLKELKSDKIIKNIVTDKLDIVDEDEFEESIQDEIDSVKEDLDDNEYDKETLVTIDTYIDATGTIRGFNFATEDAELFMALGKDGDSIRGEMKATDEDGENPFTVKLSAEENGKKYSGDITFTYSKYSYSDDDKVTKEAVLKFDDFEVVDEEKGYVNGDVAINIPDVDPIDIALSSDGKKQDVNFALRIEGTDYGKVGFTYGIKYGTDVDVPDKGDALMLDENSIKNFKLDEYVTEDELSGFFKDILKKVGFSDKFVDEYASDITDSVFDEVDSEFGDYDDDDFDWDSDDDDFDWDSDDDDDWDWDSDDDDDDFGSSSYKFDPDDFKYEDYKKYMTEEEFEEYVDEMKKYYEELEKKAS